MTNAMLSSTSSFPDFSEEIEMLPLAVISERGLETLLRIICRAQRLELAGDKNSAGALARIVADRLLQDSAAHEAAGNAEKAGLVHEVASTLSKKATLLAYEANG
jgi:hypothetical protein